MNRRSLNKVPKTKVLQAALDLFSSKGYSETKMVDVARASGLSVGALYLRFKSKEELCMELIKDRTRDFKERIEKLPEADPLETMKNYISINLECSFQKRQLLSLLFKEHKLPFLQPLRKNFFREQHRIINDILVSGIKSGAFKSLDTKDTAAMIFASIRGAVLLRIVFEIGNTKKMGASLFQLIINGIRKD